MLKDSHAARTQGRNHRAQAREWTRRKNEALTRLHRLMAPTLRYAEYAAAENVGLVDLIGWGLPRKPTYETPVVPGQAVHLTVETEGTTWVEPAWQAPSDGGPVATYRIQRCHLGEGAWTHVGSSVTTSIRLEDQETGVGLEYRVMAVNDVGDGPPSNSVRVVL